MENAKIDSFTKWKDLFGDHEVDQYSSLVLDNQELFNNCSEISDFFKSVSLPIMVKVYNKLKNLGIQIVPLKNHTENTFNLGDGMVLPNLGGFIFCSKNEDFKDNFITQAVNHIILCVSNFCKEKNRKSLPIFCLSYDKNKFNFIFIL